LFPLLRNNAKTSRFKAGIDLAGQITAGRIRFND
jgi:hypothetical protein